MTATHATIYRLVVDLLADGLTLPEAKREAARQCGVTAKVVSNAMAAHARAERARADRAAHIAAEVAKAPRFTEAQRAKLAELLDTSDLAPRPRNEG